MAQKAVRKLIPEKTKVIMKIKELFWRLKVGFSWQYRWKVIEKSLSNINNDFKTLAWHFGALGGLIFLIFLPFCLLVVLWDFTFGMLIHSIRGKKHEIEELEKIINRNS